MTSTASIGTSGHRISIPVIAPVTAPIWRKSACYERLEQALLQQQGSYSPSELIAVLNDVLPIDTTMASEQALLLRSEVNAAVTAVINLEPVCFLDSSGDEIEVEHPDIDKRPEGICYIRLMCRVQGSQLHKAIRQRDLELEFCLALPQSKRDTWTGIIQPLFHPHPHSKSSNANATNNAATLASSTSSKQSRLFKPKQSASSSHTTTSWYGRADFLDSQHAFEEEFGTSQPPLLHQDPILGNVAEVFKVIQDYGQNCQLDTALELCKYDYVGSKNAVDSTLAVQEVCKAIGSIQQEYKEKNGRKNIRCPDEMFTMYLELTPSLPEDTSLWTLRLCTTYFNALMNDLKERMLGSNFKLPQPPFKNTKEKEITALRQVREAAVGSYKKLSDELTVMSRFISTHTGQQQKSQGKHLLCAALLGEQHIPEEAPMVPVHTNMTQSTPPRAHVYQYSTLSPAEITIQRYKPGYSNGKYGSEDPPCRKGADGQMYPYHPDDPSFISKFPLGFKGCLSCGGLDHKKRDKCPMPQTTASKEEFFKELWCHKPHTKKFPYSPARGSANVINSGLGQPGQTLPPIRPLEIPQPPTVQFGNDAGQHTQIYGSQQPSGPRNVDNTPAWMRTENVNNQGSSENLQSILRNKAKQQEREIVDDEHKKRGRLFVYFAKICVSKAALPPLRQMPLALDNELPGIILGVGEESKSDISFLCHLDTCAAMNTGNLRMHQYVMTAHPELVVSYSRYDDREPFMPISLQCALSDDNNVGETNDENKLVAVVTYRTPYTSNTGDAITLSFGLGHNVSVRTIIGLPTIKAWKGVMNFVDNTFTSHTLSTRFDLLFEETQQGLPEGVKFKPEDFKRPPNQDKGSLMKVSAPPEPISLTNCAITDGCDEAFDDTSKHVVSN